jgi:hypothetical protein
MNLQQKAELAILNTVTEDDDEQLIDPKKAVAAVIATVFEELKHYESFHPADEWNEDIGSVLWWRLPIEEPPYCGTPLDSDFESDNGEWHFTHFSYIMDNHGIERAIEKLAEGKA